MKTQKRPIAYLFKVHILLHSHLELCLEVHPPFLFNNFLFTHRLCTRVQGRDREGLNAWDQTTSFQEKEKPGETAFNEGYGVMGGN